MNDARSLYDRLARVGLNESRRQWSDLAVDWRDCRDAERVARGWWWRLARVAYIPLTGRLRSSSPGRKPVALRRRRIARGGVAPVKVGKAVFFSLLFLDS